MEPGHNESHHTKYIPAARTLKPLTLPLPASSPETVGLMLLDAVISRICGVFLKQSVEIPTMTSVLRQPLIWL